MKNQVKLRTLLISATVYLFALIFVAGAGAGVLVLLVVDFVNPLQVVTTDTHVKHMV